MAFRKSSVGWKKRFKEPSEKEIKVLNKVTSEDPKLRWTPGTPGDPKRHTFSADKYKLRQRVGYVTRQNPSFVRKLRSDLDNLSLPQHVVIAKSRARQDMAVTRLTGVLLRHANKLLVKAMLYWKYGALNSLEKRTRELEEALDSSNELNEHLENQLKELTLKMDNMRTTEHLTKRKSQKLLNVSSTKTKSLEQSLNLALNNLTKLKKQKARLAQKMKSLGTTSLVRSLWRCNARSAFRVWQLHHQHLGHVLDKTIQAIVHHRKRRLRTCFDGFRLAADQNVQVQRLFLRKRRITKRNVYVKWWDFIAKRKAAGFLLGKLMVHANKRNCGPAFQKLKRYDVVLNGRALVHEIKLQTQEEIRNMQTTVEGKVVYSMYRIIIQNHKASKSKALRVWQKNMKFIIWEEQAHRRVAVYLCQKKVRTSWVHWRHLLHRRSIARLAIQKACYKNEHQVTQVRLDRGFSAFYNNCQFIVGRENAARTLGMFINRQAMNQCATALSNWVRRTHAMGMQVSLACRVDRFAQTFTRRAKLKIFREWQHVSQDIFKAIRVLLGRIGERHRKQQLRIAVTIWQRKGARNVIGAKATEALDRCIRQTILRLRRKGFNKFVMITRRARAIEHRLLGRSELKRLRTLDACWAVWCVKVVDGRAQNRLASQAANKLTLKFRKRYLQRWRTTAKESKQTRVLLTRAAAKLLNRQMHFCFELWIEHTEARQDARRLAARVFRRLVDSRLAGAWNKW